MAKPSKQPYTESCVVNRRRLLRSVDREIAGRNKVKRINVPEIAHLRGSRLKFSVRKAAMNQPLSEADEIPPGKVPTACNQVNILRTREVWPAPAGRPVKSDKPTQGKGDLKASQKSYWLIVLRDGESPLQGEAANRN